MSKNAVTTKNLLATYPTLADVIPVNIWEQLVRSRCNGRQLADLVNTGLPKLEELACNGADVVTDRGKVEYLQALLSLCGRGEALHATGISVQARATGSTRQAVSAACKAATRKMAETALHDILHSWRSMKTRQGIANKKQKAA